MPLQTWFNEVACRTSSWLDHFESHVGQIPAIHTTGCERAYYLDFTLTSHKITVSWTMKHELTDLRRWK